MEKLVIDDQHMNDIVDLYNTQIGYADSVINQLNSIKTTMNDSYSGAASEALLPDLIDKLIEHMGLLKLCYSNVGNYVSNTRDRMKWIDEVCGMSIIENPHNN